MSAPAKDGAQQPPEFRLGEWFTYGWHSQCGRCHRHIVPGDQVREARDRHNRATWWGPCCWRTP